MEQTYICDHCRSSSKISSNLRSTCAIMRSLISSISFLSQSMPSESSSMERRLFEGRWLAVSRYSELRFLGVRGTFCKSLSRVTIVSAEDLEYLGLMYGNLNGIEDIFASESFLGQMRTRQSRRWAGWSVPLRWGSTGGWFVVGKVGTVDWGVRWSLDYSNWRKTYVIRI